MIAPLLAVTITLQALVNAAQDFATRAGLDTPPVITTNLVSRFKIYADTQQGFVIVNNNHGFDYMRGVIQSYTDRRENVAKILTRCDPAELKRWSEQKSLIDTNGALAIAREQFHRLGFKDEDFQAPSCHQYEWKPVFQRGAPVFYFPVFKVEWIEKGGAKMPQNGLGPTVVMTISGTTKRMVYFSSSGLMAFGKNSARGKAAK